MHGQTDRVDSRILHYTTRILVYCTVHTDTFVSTLTHLCFLLALHAYDWFHRNVMNNPLHRSWSWVYIWSCERLNSSVHISSRHISNPLALARFIAQKSKYETICYKTSRWKVHRKWKKYRTKLRRAPLDRIFPARAGWSSHKVTDRRQEVEKLRDQLSQYKHHCCVIHSPYEPKDRFWIVRTNRFDFWSKDCLDMCWWLFRNDAISKLE